jgi:hypothetical protein
MLEAITPLLINAIASFSGAYLAFMSRVNPKLAVLRAEKAVILKELHICKAKIHALEMKVVELETRLNNEHDRV